VDRKKLLNLAAFVFAVLTTVLAGFYKEVNDQERLAFAIELPAAGAGQIARPKKVYSLDLARQGLAKNILQPDKISLYGRLKIKGTCDSVQVDFQGLDGYVSQGGKKSRWPELKKNDSLKPRKNGWMPVNIEVKLPEERLNSYYVATARLLVADGVKELGEVEFNVINSRVKENP
jgi:hypothetical protein